MKGIKEGAERWKEKDGKEGKRKDNGEEKERREGAKKGDQRGERQGKTMRVGWKAKKSEKHKKIRNSLHVVKSYGYCFLSF